MIDERLLYLSLYRYMMRSAKGNCTMTLKATDFQGPQKGQKVSDNGNVLNNKNKKYIHKHIIVSSFYEKLK